MKKVALFLLIYSNVALGQNSLLPPCEVDGVQTTYLITAPFAYYASGSPAVANVINGKPTITVNPALVAVMPTETRQHMFHHECAHVQLKHIYTNSNTLSPEQTKKIEFEADCEGARRLVNDEGYDRAKLQVLHDQTVFGSPLTDPTHGTNTDRAQRILSCGLEALNAKYKQAKGE
jgi:hypothetical protein